MNRFYRMQKHSFEKEEARRLRRADTTGDAESIVVVDRTSHFEGRKALRRDRFRYIPSICPLYKWCSSRQAIHTLAIPALYLIVLNITDILG